LVLQTLIDAEAAQQIGAQPYERTDTRTAYQNLWPAFSFDSYWTVAMPGIVTCRRGSGTSEAMMLAHTGALTAKLTANRSN
jgi:hypothetical protein